MKNFSFSIRFSRRLFMLFAAATLAGSLAAWADSPIDGFKNTASSLWSTSNWSTGAVPAASVTGTISNSGGNSPIGFNNHTNPAGGSIGDLDFVNGAGNLVVGAYNTQTSDTTANITVTLLGSTLNSISNTVIANSSGSPILFENDVNPGSGDDSTEAATTTLQLNNSSNVIQSTASSNIIIDDAITGSGDALTFYGGGTGSTSGAILDLGAGSAYDVAGGVAANAPSPSHAGTFTGTATVETGDQNTFTGGLTIGDVGGTANAGTVQVDAPHGLPTAGTITVNTNSQLALNGNGTYGGTSQVLVLNGPGTSATSGALVTTSGTIATWQGTVNVASASTINAQGSTGSLTLSGSISGSSLVTKKGAGLLDLTGDNSAFSGGFSATNGTLEAGNANAFGTGSISLAAATLTSSLANTPATLGGLTVTTGTVDLLAQSNATFSLSTGQNFTMSGGAVDLTYSGGNTGSISSAGGGSELDITGGTLSLGGGSWNYSQTYDLFSGFGSGTVSGLTITGYDSTDYTANVSNSGELSFEAVPEPGTWGMAVAALGTLITIQQVRRRRRA